MSGGKLNQDRTSIAIITFVVVTGILGAIQYFISTPMLLAERFMAGAGWIQVLLIAGYAGIIGYHIANRQKRGKWRMYSWLLFTILFYLQLIAGIFINDIFLLTGKLHIPVPAMIIAGPIYRFQLSVMSLLFISTIILSGPSWCSHLCYFGAIDNLFASHKKTRNTIDKKLPIKLSILSLTIAVTILLKWLNINTILATSLGIGIGIIGLLVMLLVSRQKGKMVHCTTFCPVGTVVNYTSKINPFRLYIDNNCTECQKCTAFCNYDALNLKDIISKKPDITCTLCGDCLTSCHTKSINYKFAGLRGVKAERIYLIITISLHAIFLAMGRI